MVDHRIAARVNGSHHHNSAVGECIVLMEQHPLPEHTTTFGLDGFTQAMNKGCIVVSGDALLFLNAIVEQHALRNSKSRGHHLAQWRHF